MSKLLPEDDVITITGILKFENPSDEGELFRMMRSQSACMRMAHGRLLKGDLRKDLKKELQNVFDINSRYVDDGIFDADDAIKASRKLNRNPKNVIFGGRKVYNRLQKKHLSKNRLEELYNDFREKRQCNLFSRGDKSKKGNPNIQFFELDEKMFFRINIGNNKWIVGQFISKHKKLNKLRLASQLSIAYTVRILTRQGVSYAHVSVTEKFPTPKIGVGNNTIKDIKYEDIPMLGPVLSIDRNSFPSHIAWTIVGQDGNLLAKGIVKTSELYDQRSDKREYYAWKYAHEIVKIAEQYQAGIALETIKIKQGKKKKSESRRTRRKKASFCYRSMFDKVTTLARRNSIFVKPVTAAYSTIIGTMKYASIYDLSKHQAAAFVIGRRALGYNQERVPQKLQKVTEAFVERTKKFHSVLDKVRVTQGKKESNPYSGHHWMIWEVVKRAVLTAHSTGWKKVWNKLNPSILKRQYLRDCRDRWLDPLPGGGSVSASFASQLDANSP